MKKSAITLQNATNAVHQTLVRLEKARKSKERHRIENFKARTHLEDDSKGDSSTPTVDGRRSHWRVRTYAFDTRQDTVIQVREVESTDINCYCFALQRMQLCRQLPPREEEKIARFATLGAIRFR